MKKATDQIELINRNITLAEMDGDEDKLSRLQQELKETEEETHSKQETQDTTR